MTISMPRRLFTAAIGEPIELAIAQPQQVLLSAGSVAIMAQFAASGGIVPPWVGCLIAAGVEWAYLKGLSDNSKAKSWWGDALSWSAFAIVVLWGVLWVASLSGVLIAHASVSQDWFLSFAHVVPVAWLSLCAAMCHSRSAAVEQDQRRQLQDQEESRQRRLQAERDAIQIEAERKRIEAETYAVGLVAVAEAKAQAKAVTRRVFAANTDTSVSGTVRASAPAASGRQTNTDREQLREQIVRTLSEQPGVSKTELARTLGIGRTTLYELINEAKTKGELL